MYLSRFSHARSADRTRPFQDDPRGTQRRIVIDIDSSDDGLGHPVARGAGFDPDDEEAESDGSDGDDWVDDAEVDFHDASQGSTSTVSVQPSTLRFFRKRERCD